MPLWMLFGPKTCLEGFSCRTKSGFNGSKPSWISLRDVSENQIWQGLAVREHVTTLANCVVPGRGGGTKTSRERVIWFNQFATCCSSEPAIGRNVPVIVSSCEVPGIYLCTVSCLTPPARFEIDEQVWDELRPHCHTLNWFIELSRPLLEPLD